MFYNIVYTMWDYAKKQGGTTAQIFESLYDDLDAAFGHEKWRMSRNMDEQPSKGEHAIVFTYADGLDGDFQIFVQGRPKMAVVITGTRENRGTISGASIYSICCSARQAEMIRATIEVCGHIDEAWVEIMDIEPPHSRLDIARSIVDDDPDNLANLLESNVLSYEEKRALIQPIGIARADEREKQS